MATTRRLTLLAVLLAPAACAHRVVAPRPPAAVTPSSELDASLSVGQFSVRGETVVDDATDTLQLQKSFVDYLTSTTRFSHNGDGPPLTLDVTIRVNHNLYRTWYVDYLNLMPILLGSFVPTWGSASLELQARLSDHDGKELALYERSVDDTFSATVWSWYRTDFVEDSFARMYEAAFSSIAHELAGDTPRLAQLLETEHRTAQASQPAQRPPYERPPSQFALIEQVPSRVDGTLLGYLSLLGGVEGAAFAGSARVSSSFNDENGDAIEVGAGLATQTGYRISLYTRPQRTGFFWYPTIGFLTQEISISGFRDDLIEAQQSPDEIEGLCSDPDTGEERDCAAPNVYDLEIEGGYAGLRAGYQAVAGSRWVQVFFSINAGINLLEYRSLRLIVGANDATESGWDGLRSGAFGWTMGIVFPRLHFGLRAVIDYEVYREIDYEHDIPFRGPAKRIGDRMERPLQFVDAASLQSFNVQGTVFLVF